jgi:hypothetical protein
MKNALRYSVLLLLGMMFGIHAATAADPSTAAPALVPTPEAICEAQQPATAPAVALQFLAPEAAGLFAPALQQAAICPLIGCVNDEYCRRDRDCTSAPGGVCDLFCPTQGCCAYPAP